MIKLDADVPITTHDFYKYSIEVLGIRAMATIHGADHSTLYKYAKDPARFPEGEARTDPLLRLLAQCGDLAKMDGRRGEAAVRVVAAMFANIVGCDVTPRASVTPDKPDVKGECLDDYPPLVRLHALIEQGAPKAVVQDQLRVLIQELLETIATYEAQGGQA